MPNLSHHTPAALEAALAEQAGPTASLLELSQAIYHGTQGFAGAGCTTTFAYSSPAVSDGKRWEIVDYVPARCFS